MVEISSSGRSCAYHIVLFSVRYLNATWRAYIFRQRKPVYRTSKFDSRQWRFRAVHQNLKEGRLAQYVYSSQQMYSIALSE